MKRNQFLKTLLGGVVCLPVIGTIVAQNKDMEVARAVSPDNGIDIDKELIFKYSYGYSALDVLTHYRATGTIILKEDIGYEGGQEALLHWNNKTNKT